MSDLLFWMLLLLVVVVVLRRRAQAAVQRDERPALAYRHVDGAALLLGEQAQRADAGWRPLGLEDLPFAQRKRLVLSIALDVEPSLRRLERLLWTLARQLQERALAHVVVVEAFAAGAPQAAGAGALRLLFAPDGRGWTGEETVIAALEGTAQPSRAYRLGEVQAKILETLDDAPLSD